MSHTHTQIDKHFPEIVKSYSGHRKTCKSIKNPESKIVAKPILSFIYVGESKKKGKENVILFKNIYRFLLAMYNAIFVRIEL